MGSNTVNVRYSSCQIIQLRAWRIRLLVIKVEGINALSSLVSREDFLLPAKSGDVMQSIRTELMPARVWVLGLLPIGLASEPFSRSKGGADVGVLLGSEHGALCFLGTELVTTRKLS
jgi:hypothetical protein